MSDDEGTGTGSGSPGGSGSGGGSRRGPAPAPAAVELLSVVEFLHADPITREPYRAVGVVVELDEHAVTVRPLASHRVSVAPADVAALTADDTGEV